MGNDHVDRATHSMIHILYLIHHLALYCAIDGGVSGYL